MEDRVIAGQVNYFSILWQAINDLRILWNSEKVNYDRISRALDFVEVLADPLLDKKDREEYLRKKSELIGDKKVLSPQEYYNLQRLLLKTVLRKLAKIGVLFPERMDLVIGEYEEGEEE